MKNIKMIIIYVIVLIILFVLLITMGKISSKRNNESNNNESNNEINANVNELDNENLLSDESVDIKNNITFEIRPYINPEDVLTEKEKKYVSHAGGKYGNDYYLNCKEAIDNSYNIGFKLIEIDVAWTTDNVPILLHSWGDNTVRLFGEGKEEVVSYEEFQTYNMINGLTKLSLQDIVDMIRSDEYKNVYFITDTKDDNTKLLRYINDNYNDVKNSFIPQIYNQDEYHLGKELGFENLIYTLYRSSDTKEQIVEFSKTYRPYAITMDTYWAHSDLPLLLTAENIYTYTYTLNDIEKFNFLKTNGIKGIYTDILFE